MSGQTELSGDGIAAEANGAPGNGAGEGAGGASSRQSGVRTLGIRLGLISDPPGDYAYHGFISYSHAADGQLAPALQKGLYQFAKPWYRTRALRIFRDEAALSANPHLWTSVREALDASLYFILLASPQAAHSEWVAREVDYWCEHRSPERILIGLTEGELAFGAEPRPVLAPEDNALPAKLERAFTEEPRYIDLRWARAADDLSISHPRFRDAVAELAAPLHGKPKDQLASEEVRQHRRTVRIARAAAATIVTLLMLAVIGAFVALSERNTAVTQARIAGARQLAAVAQSQLATNLDVALPLAVRAYRDHADAQTRAALLQADLYSPRLVRFVPMGARISQLVASTSGRVMAAGLADGRVMRWALGQSAPAEVAALGGPVSGIAADATGSEIVATDRHRALLWRRGHKPASFPAPTGQTPQAVAVSPSGATVAISYSIPNRVFTGPQSVMVFTRQSGALHPLPTSGPGGWAPGTLLLPSDSQIVLFSNGYGNWERLSLPGWLPQGGGSAQFGVHDGNSYISADGSSFTTTNGASTIPVWQTAGRTSYDTQSGTAEAPISAPSALALSPNGRAIAVADSGTIYVAPVAPPGKSRAPAVALPGEGAVTAYGLQFLGDDTHLLSASGQTVALWDLNQVDRLATVYRTPLDVSPCNGCDGADLSVSPSGAAVAAVDDRTSIVQELRAGTKPRVLQAGNGSYGPPVWTANGQTVLLPAATRSTPSLLAGSGPRSPSVRVWPAGEAGVVASALSDNGRVAIIIDPHGAVIREDPDTGRVLSTVRGPSDLSGSSSTSRTLTAGVGEAAIDPADRMAAILHQASAGLMPGWRELVVEDVSSGRVVGVVRGAAITAIAYAGSRLVIQRDTGELEVWNASGTRLLRLLPGDASFLLQPAVSPGGALAARQRLGGSIVLVDLSSGLTLATLPPPLDPSLGLKIGLGLSPTGDDLLESVQTIAGTPPRMISRNISPSALIAAACRAAGGGLTVAQWRTFVGTSVPADLNCR